MGSGEQDISDLNDFRHNDLERAFIAGCEPAEHEGADQVSGEFHFWGQDAVHIFALIAAVGAEEISQSFASGLSGFNLAELGRR